MRLSLLLAVAGLAVFVAAFLAAAGVVDRDADAVVQLLAVAGILLAAAVVISL